MSRQLFSKLKSFIAKTNKPSCVSSLRKIMGRKQFNALLKLTPDRRQLFEFASKELLISEPDLLLKISRMINVPYLSRVLPADINLVSPELFSLCRRCGAIPVTSEGVITGLVCSDPELVESIAQKLALHQTSGAKTAPNLYLGSWSLISKALDESELYSKSAAQRKEEEEARKLLDTAKRVTAFLVDESSNMGATGLEIQFSPERISYAFMTGDGRRATGNVDRRIRGPLLKYLQDFVKSGEFLLLSFIKREGQARVAVSLDDDVYFLSWTAEPALEPLSDKVVNFPTPQHSRSAEVPAKAEVELSQDHLVLIVDDNSTFARVLEKFLARHNLKSAYADGGERAFAFLDGANELPSLIVCDVHMPNMNGIEFIQRLRADSRFANIPVVMLTSDDDVEIELKLLSYGADAFITKNEDPRILCVQVKRLIEKAKRLKAA